MEKEIDKSFSLNILRHNFDFEEYKIFIEYVFKKIVDTEINSLTTKYNDITILGKYEHDENTILFLICNTNYSIFSMELNNYIREITNDIGKNNVFISIYNNFQKIWRLTYVSCDNLLLNNSFIVGEDLNTYSIVQNFKYISNNKNTIIEKVSNLFSHKKYENKFISCYIKVCKNIINIYLDDKLKNNINNNKNIIEEFQKSEITNIWINKIELFVNKVLIGFILLKFIIEKENFYNSKKYVHNMIKNLLGYDIESCNNIYDILTFCNYKNINFYCIILCPLVNSLYKEIGINYTLYYGVIDIPNNLFMFVEKNFKDYNFKFYPNDIYDKYVCINPDVFSRLLQIILRTDYKKYNGTYYTPKHVVKYMCNKSIINFLFKDYINDNIDKKYEIYFNNSYKCIVDNYNDKSVLVDKYNKLNLVKIVDLCVGSGEFIIEALNIIINIKKEIRKYITTKKFDIYREIYSTLEKNLYAYDIEIYALVVTKLRLYFFVISIMYKDDYSTIKNNNKSYESQEIKNIQLKDSLELEKSYNNNFDIVLGNPPYVGEKSDKEYFRKISKSDFGKSYYCAKMDLFYYFFHKSLDILNIGGTVNFITTNYFLTADGACKLRQDIYNRSIIKEIVNFNNVKLFNNALGQHNQITFLERTSSSNNFSAKVVNISSDLFYENNNYNNLIYLNNKNKYYYLDKDNLYDTANYYIRITNIDNDINNILNKISLGNLLSKYCNINQGLVSGADKLSYRHINKYNHVGNKGEGIFVITNNDIDMLNINKEEYDIIKPFFKNSDINKYRTKEETDKIIMYINKDFNNFENMYPNIYYHLLKYKKILSDRREVRKKSIKFYMLQWPRKETIFKSEKIVCPQRNNINKFAYNHCDWYASADVYFITKKNKSVDLKYILAILNSNLYYVWFYYKGKRKGDLLELYQTPLKQTPIIIDIRYKDKVVDLINKILSEEDNSKVAKYDKQINNLIYKIYNINKEEIIKIENLLVDKLYNNIY